MAEKSSGFSAAEKAAMKQRARELKAEQSRAAGLAALREKVEGLTGAERVLAEGIVDTITAAAPHLEPRTFYGAPAWAIGGKVVCFFQPASLYGVRYATLGFTETAQLDDGAMWPSSFAIVELTDAVRAQVRELITRAAG